MRFVAELKRRNVIRMAGLYLVGAWLVTQVAATSQPVDAPTLRLWRRRLADTDTLLSDISRANRNLRQWLAPIAGDPR